MDIESAEESYQNVTYGDDTYRNLVNHLQDGFGSEKYHLCLFIGKRDESKEDAVNELADRTDRAVYYVDANDVISKIESETYENLDRVFADYDAGNALFVLDNASRLCGAYTGYTQSSVKYATPQERYFLNKMQETGGLFVLDIAVSNDTDNTIRRAAQSIVNFPPPQSGLKKLFWRLKKVGVHGYQIKTERPEHYGDQPGNF